MRSLLPVFIFLLALSSLRAGEVSCQNELNNSRDLNSIQEISDKLSCNSENAIFYDGLLIRDVAKSTIYPTDTLELKYLFPNLRTIQIESDKVLLKPLAFSKHGSNDGRTSSTEHPKRYNPNSYNLTDCKIELNWSEETFNYLTVIKSKLTLENPVLNISKSSTHETTLTFDTRVAHRAAKLVCNLKLNESKTVDLLGKRVPKSRYHSISNMNNKSIYDLHKIIYETIKQLVPDFNKEDLCLPVQYAELEEQFKNS